MTLPCPVPRCDRLMPGHLPVCQACSAGLIRDLADVADLSVNLQITLVRQARIGDRESGRSTETAVPWNQRAREAGDILRSALVGWHRVLVEGARRAVGPTCEACDHASCLRIELTRDRPAGTLAGLSRWLIRHRARLLRHPAAAEAVDELTDAVHQARRVIDRPPDVWYAGPCTCGADLYAHHGSSVISCRACGAHVSTAAQVRWLMTQAADHLGTAVEIARALNTWHPGITPSVVRGYAHRRRLLARGRDHVGRPLYRVGDVLDLLAGGTMLHGPACKACEHASCREIRGEATARSA